VGSRCSRRRASPHGDGPEQVGEGLPACSPGLVSTPSRRPRAQAQCSQGKGRADRSRAWGPDRKLWGERIGVFPSQRPAAAGAGAGAAPLGGSPGGGRRAPGRPAAHGRPAARGRGAGAGRPEGSARGWGRRAARRGDEAEGDEADSPAHDQRFWARVLLALEPGTLRLLDRGGLTPALFARLTAAGVGLPTRARQNAAHRVERALAWGPAPHDQLIWLGRGASRCTHLLRLVGVRHAGTRSRSLPNVLDPAGLPAPDVAARYAGRWDSEAAFPAVARRLGLASVSAGATDAVQPQLWASWLRYAVLVAPTAAVAAPLHRPSAPSRWSWWPAGSTTSRRPSSGDR
jgi:hypothetical protein